MTDGAKRKGQYLRLEVQFGWVDYKIG